MKDKVTELYRRYRELIVYFIVGVLTTLVNWISYAALAAVLPAEPEFFGAPFNVTVANALAWVIAVAFAYVTNKIFVFQSRSWEPAFVLREVFLFVSARILTGLLEIVAVPLLVSLGVNQPLLGVDGMWAKVLVSAIVMVLNYVFSKLIVFRSGDKSAK